MRVCARVSVCVSVCVCVCVRERERESVYACLSKTEQGFAAREQNTFICTEKAHSFCSRLSYNYLQHLLHATLEKNRKTESV